MNIICILNTNKADILKAKGFNYHKTKIDNKTVYKFMNTPELEIYLNSNFSNQDFFSLPYENFNEGW